MINSSAEISKHSSSELIEVAFIGALHEPSRILISDEYHSFWSTEHTAHILIIIILIYSFNVWNSQRLVICISWTQPGALIYPEFCLSKSDRANSALSSYYDDLSHLFPLSLWSKKEDNRKKAIVTNFSHHHHNEDDDDDDDDEKVRRQSWPSGALPHPRANRGP